MRTLTADADSTHVGVQLIAVVANSRGVHAQVYTLKLYIVVNLAVIAGLGGRLILILGTDHAHFFRKFAGEHLYVTLISSLAYLYPRLASQSCY